MILERTLAGLEARLTSRGMSRFGGVAFLAVWLCFWIVGETVAVGILVAGAWALLTGQPMGAEGDPLEIGPALVTGIFLLGWVAFWTLGGFMAWHELFRLLWSSDRLLARGDGLELVRRVGPFTKRRFLAMESLRGFFRVDAHQAVQAETTGGVVELTRNGTPAEQAQLIAALTAELRLPAADTLPPLLPTTWREVRAPETGEVLVRDPATRRTAARVMWLVALPLAWAALMVVREAGTKPNLRVVAALVTGVAALALWGAGRLTWLRDEWRLERGRIVEQRRFGRRCQERFIGVALRLTETRDSDGDRWFTLVVQGEGGASRKLSKQMHEPTELRQLGRWLAARTGIPLEDLATPEMRMKAEAEQAAWQAEQRRQVREWAATWIEWLPGSKRRK